MCKHSDHRSGIRNISHEIESKFGPVDDKKRFLNSGLRVSAPQQSHSSIDQLFDDADVLSAPFQDLICCWMNGSPNIADFCDKEFVDLFSLNAPLPGKPPVLGKQNVGPIKQITRSIAKIHRSYSGNFRLLTDLVSESTWHTVHS